MEQLMNHGFNKLATLHDFNSCYSRDSSLQKNSKNYVKNFTVYYNSVYGRYESSQTENGKNHFRAEFGAGLYHHVLNSCCSYKASHSEYL